MLMLLCAKCFSPIHLVPAPCILQLSRLGAPIRLLQLGTVGDSVTET
jgi:hypothetical protein